MRRATGTCWTTELATPYASAAFVLSLPASVPNTVPAMASAGTTDSMTRLSCHDRANAIAYPTTKVVMLCAKLPAHVLRH